MKHRTHVIPLNDLKPHTEYGESCACKPLVREEENLVIHNSWDGREFYETDNPNLQSVERKRRLDA